MEEGNDLHLNEDSELDEEFKREIDMEDEFYSFLDGEIEEFKKQSILTKESLLQSINDTRKKFKSEKLSGQTGHATAFYECLDKLLERLTTKLHTMILPEPLNEWWYYSYEITSRGIKLILNHLSWNYYSSSLDCSRDQKFVLADIPAALLTVYEYAQKYGVEPGTVRQWIRRAKIRSAVKAGREWRIPELAELRTERDYQPCRYVWDMTLTNIPEKYAFLNEFGIADFVQDSEDKTRFYIYAYPYSSEDARFNSFLTDPLLDPILDTELAEKIIAVLSRYPGLTLTKEGGVCLTGKEREELELYMIGNPLVRVSPPKWAFEKFSDQIAEIGSDYCPMFFTQEWSY